jgi:hypothetical protein
VQQNGLEQPKGLRQLNNAGKQAVDLMAEQIANQVDQILSLQWDRRKGEFALPVLADDAATPSLQETVQATCSCGSGIPIQKVLIGGSEITLIALPVMLQQFKEAGKVPGTETITELLDLLKIYNPVPAGEESIYRDMLLTEYSAYYEKEPSK